jgi:hypothetical protein
MNPQPTSSNALVAVNEAKAWEWKCPPNRKEDLVKLDLAAHRANIAGVPSCRSLRCNDDKAYAARERSLLASAICCRVSNCVGFHALLCTLGHRKDAGPPGNASKASTTAHCCTCRQPSISTGVAHDIIYPTTSSQGWQSYCSTRPRVVHIQLCRALSPSCRRVEIRKLLLEMVD